MSKKLIYLTSFVLVLSLVSNASGQIASNPTPADGSEHDDTWALLSWSPGQFAVSHDVYLGENFDDVNHGTGETFRGNKTFTLTPPTLFVGFIGFPYPDGLVPGTTYYWRIDGVNDRHPDSPWKGDVWSFWIPPYTAYDPHPPDGAKFIDPDVELSWTAGFHARLHYVYFGDNFDEVSNASEGRFQGKTTYSPGTLEVDKTYYWRVDESYDGVTMHKGDVWSFTVGAGEPADVVGGTIYVDAVNGDDNNDGLTPQAAFATIQKGIDAAADGEVVLVYPGLYQEEISFLGKTLTVQGVVASPTGVPVLQNPGDFAVSFYYGEGPDSVLKNFIIRDSFMGVFIADSSPTISNLTIVDNKYGIEAYAGSEPDISSTILWNNTDGDLFGCRAWYSCVERGGESEGNITVDPLFVDPDSGDYHLRSERGRYWPEHDIWVLDKVTSPCVDGGEPTADYSGEPMPNGGRINMGAYGGSDYASMSEMSPGLNYPPVVIIKSPEDGAEFGWGTVPIEAYAWDVDGVVVKVEFFADGDKIGEDNDGSDGWALEIEWSDFTVDEYEIIVRATDNDGASTDSTAIEIEISLLPLPRIKGRGCFTGETGVWVDGALVPISKVVPGRNVACIDSAGVSGSSIRPLGKVEKLQEHEGTFVCYDVLLESGNRISVAENHYFLTESGRWVSLQKLTAQTRLRTSKGSIGIISVTRRPVPYVGKVYNLKIEGSHRYLVGKDAVIVRDY